ncbi:hypothetical protein EON66_05100 [archaeon]|nr:MAG: hypothetical protein EON66_05100 [archaeon]
MGVVIASWGLLVLVGIIQACASRFLRRQAPTASRPVTGGAALVARALDMGGTSSPGVVSPTTVTKAQHAHIATLVMRTLRARLPTHPQAVAYTQLPDTQAQPLARGGGGIAGAGLGLSSAAGVALAAHDVEVTTAELELQKDMMKRSAVQMEAAQHQQQVLDARHYAQPVPVSFNPEAAMPAAPAGGRRRSSASSDVGGGAASARRRSSDSSTAAAAAAAAAAAGRGARISHPPPGLHNGDPAATAFPPQVQAAEPPPPAYLPAPRLGAPPYHGSGV